MTAIQQYMAIAEYSYYYQLIAVIYGNVLMSLQLLYLQRTELNYVLDCKDNMGTHSSKENLPIFLSLDIQLPNVPMLDLLFGCTPPNPYVLNTCSFSPKPENLNLWIDYTPLPLEYLNKDCVEPGLSEIDQLVPHISIRIAFANLHSSLQSAE